MANLRWRTAQLVLHCPVVSNRQRVQGARLLTCAVSYRFQATSTGMSRQGVDRWGTSDALELRFIKLYEHHLSPMSHVSDGR